MRGTNEAARRKAVQDIQHFINEMNDCKKEIERLSARVKDLKSKVKHIYDENFAKYDEDN